jgi:signal transduction histidine kinase
MRIANLKYKHLLACILLLGIFILGYNFKWWYATNHRVKKHISFVYSFAVNETGCQNFEELVRQEFRKKGIEPVFDKFYLDCMRLNEEEKIKHTKVYLELLKSKPVDLIMSIGDQATYALLSARHQLLASVPVVACNVNFPNEKLLKEYESKKIYVLRDTPDFKRNIEFIKTLQPDTSGLEVVFNIDLTFLGRTSFDLLSQSVNRKDVQVLGQKSMYALEDKYEALNDMVEYYKLTAALTDERIRENELTISLYPFRYIKGMSLLVMMEKSKSEQANKAFLQDKFDMMSLPIVNALNIPSFSCIREGFGGESKIVGGYMATEEISAHAAVDLSVRLINKEKIGMPKVRDLDKEYVLNWKSFSAYSSSDIKKVPKHTRIINYPFFEHYRKELNLLLAIFVFAFIFISVSLLRMRRRSAIERKNMKMLEETHKRLTLSADGGQIALWNMQGSTIEFDENYARLAGLKQRQFSRAEFSELVHPDDRQLLSNLHETLLLSTDTQIQRVRLCFGKEEDYQWYELRCRSLKDTKGIVRLAGIMQNIQEVVGREQQLVLAKQMAEKAELKQSFLNNISHEIRTPLNSIVGFTNMLTGEGADEIEPDEKASMVEIINHNNTLLLKLIEDMVEISHLDSGYMSFEIKQWNMTDIIKEVYAAYQLLLQPSLLFNLDLDETLCLPVNIDRQRFIQVISNFLDNANKFTREGHITLGCQVIKDRNEVRIYVEDTGKGIDKEELIMIFDRFYKSDEFEQGSGLGLSISKVIIEKLSGRIEVQSEAGKGSCFSVSLSLAAQ